VYGARPPIRPGCGTVCGVDVDTILGLYAQGLFPMDEPGAPSRGELPWWVADPRTVFELDAESRASVTRRVRRSLRGGPDRIDWELRLDGAFEEVVARCARPRAPGDGVWLTERMQALYRVLHAAGHAHTFEVWADGELAAGLVSVTIGRAAMLESMFHRVPHAGNALVALTLEALAGGGCELCDIQTATPHTLRLGAVEIPRAEYEARLRAAVSG
jgi:leucyl/phenylalanyl-tRNA--protein transferase